jgi:folate-binding protein YgfZ
MFSQKMTSKLYYRAMSHFGRFRVSGKDAATLLHHLTTNNIKKLQSGQGCDAILVSNKARVLDWLQIWRAGDDFLVLTSPNRRAMFSPHAQKFVLYRQDVKIEDVSENGAMLGFFGDGAPGVLPATGQNAPLNALVKTEIDGAVFCFSRTRRLPKNGVLVWSEHAEKVQKFARDFDAQNCDDATFNALRIAAGIPVAGLELTEEINPWEANLDFAISLDKGCYNGQEVIARLHTYKKIKQRLMGLKLKNAFAAGERIPLKSGERNAGVLTSSAPAQNGAIGLGFVRSDFQNVGEALEVGSTPGQKAVVCDLPLELI